MRNQFLSVIEYVDESDKILVKKFNDGADHEIKQGSKVIVREGQCAVFLQEGRLADILPAGTYKLDTKNLPILTDLKAFPYKFNSPIKSDLYFVSLKQSVDNKWSTKNPIITRDKELGVMRLRAFGTYAFRIIDVPTFMREVFGSQRKVMTWDIVQYFASFIPEAFSEIITDLNISVFDLGSKYKFIADEIKNKVSKETANLGIEFTNVNIENISLPDEVEKLIDEQSGMGLASQDMKTYAQYQSLRAMRDASKQESGIAGLGAGIAISNQIVNGMSSASNSSRNIDPTEEIQKYKKLLDDGILTQEEFDKKKKELLNL